MVDTARALAIRLKMAGVPEDQIDAVIASEFPGQAGVGRSNGVETPSSETVEMGGAAEKKPAADSSGGSAKKAMMGAAQGESVLDAASNAAIMSGNPYAMAAGAGLKVVSLAGKAKQAREQQRIQAEQERQDRIQRAITNMMSAAQGFKL